MEGLVCDIQRFSIQDGPGIRTTVFLQGCTLRCAWCHNPEAIPARPVMMRVNTGGKEAEKPSSQPMTACRVMDVVLEDRPFYRQSGGGLTVSGGEPLLQAEFSLELLRLARAAGIHTALDTAGHVPWDALSAALPLTDLFLYDYKVSRDAARWLGAQDGRIRDNLGRLARAGAAIILRCPVIPGVNDNEEHLRAIAALLKDHPSIRSVELMAYHRLGTSKYRALGQAYSLEKLQPVDGPQKAAFLAQAKRLIAHPIKWG